MNKSAVAFFFLFFLHGTSIVNSQQGISYNVLRLCVRLRSVGIERSGSLHKTDVSCCCGLFIRNFKLKNK